MSSSLKIAGAVLAVIILIASGLLFRLNQVAQTTEYCGSCHVMDTYYQSWKTSDYSAHSHAQASVPCQKCHPQSLSGAFQEQVKNLTNNYPKPLPPIQVSNDECFQCHQDFAHLAERTRSMKYNPHDSPHGNQPCRACHKMHSSSANYCAQCHPAAGITKPGWGTTY